MAHETYHRGLKLLGVVAAVLAVNAINTAASYTIYTTPAGSGARNIIPVFELALIWQYVTFLSTLAIIIWLKDKIDESFYGFFRNIEPERTMKHEIIARFGESSMLRRNYGILLIVCGALMLAALILYVMSHIELYPVLRNTLFYDTTTKQAPFIKAYLLQAGLGVYMVIEGLSNITYYWKVV